MSEDVIPVRHLEAVAERRKNNKYSSLPKHITKSSIIRTEGGGNQIDLKKFSEVMCRNFFLRHPLDPSFNIYIYIYIYFIALPIFAKFNSEPEPAVNRCLGFYLLSFCLFSSGCHWLNSKSIFTKVQ
jgi:hypothetical protein